MEKRGGGEVKEGSEHDAVARSGARLRERGSGPSIDSRENRKKRWRREDKGKESGERKELKDCETRSKEEEKMEMANQSRLSVPCGGVTELMMFGIC